MLTKIGIEVLAAHGLDDASRPVQADAVFRALTGVEHERRAKTGQMAGMGAWNSHIFHVAPDDGGPELVSVAGGVGEQMAQGDGPLGQAQPWRAAFVEAVEHLRRSKLVDKSAERLVKSPSPLL